MLENLRFHKGEEKNDPAFAKALAKLGDIFVNDAFSAAHRAHASTDAIARLLPSYAGPLLMEEVDALRSVLEKPERPTAAVIGGAKVSTKIDVLTNLAGQGRQADHRRRHGQHLPRWRKGVKIGKSLAEPDLRQDGARDHACRQGAAAARSCCRHDVVVAAEVRGRRARRASCRRWRRRPIR